MSTGQRISPPLRVDRLPTGQRQLVRDLVIDLGVDLEIGDDNYDGFTTSDAPTTVVTVPKCFVTDFSSIPHVARPLFRFDAVDLAGCCHDLAYRVGVPRSTADRIWRIVATSGSRKVGPIRGFLGWLGLRIGAGFAYKPTGDPFRRHKSDVDDRDGCDA
ncbi:MAG: DUF1353 domain-containing protein [Acidimicrobiia bacterium]|nr:DUF1353 domain-containing protein [Acidimicrobiia bacterium]